MPGMMRSRVSGRGTWCCCCSAWTATRAQEKRDWQCEDWTLDWTDPEWDYLRGCADEDYRAEEDFVAYDWELSCGNGWPNDFTS